MNHSIVNCHLLKIPSYLKLNICAISKSGLSTDKRYSNYIKGYFNSDYSIKI